jgi:predicted amidohydrolase
VASAKIVDPGGEILADTGVRPGLAVTELDVQQALESARRSMAHLRDRRPDAYTDPALRGLRAPDSVRQLRDSVQTRHR